MSRRRDDLSDLPVRHIPDLHVVAGVNPDDVVGLVAAEIADAGHVPFRPNMTDGIVECDDIGAVHVPDRHGAGVRLPYYVLPSIAGEIAQSNSQISTCPELLAHNRSEAPSPLKSPIAFALHAALILAFATMD